MGTLKVTFKKLIVYRPNEKAIEETTDKPIEKINDKAIEESIEKPIDKPIDNNGNKESGNLRTDLSLKKMTSIP